MSGIPQQDESDVHGMEGMVTSLGCCPVPCRSDLPGRCIFVFLSSIIPFPSLSRHPPYSMLADILLILSSLRALPCNPAPEGRNRELEAFVAARFGSQAQAHAHAPSG